MRIKENIVQFRIIVGKPQRQFSRLQQIGQYLRLGFTRFDKGNLRRCRRCPFAAVLFHRLFKRLITFRRIVEIRDCLMQCLCRIIRQLRLESAESQPAGIQRFLILRLIQRDHIINQPVNAKAAALCILKIILSVHSRQRLHRSPLGIAALLRDLPAQIIRHVNDILHQSFHILEDLGIDLLQNILLPSRSLHGKGMIDVPAAVRPH